MLFFREKIFLPKILFTSFKRFSNRVWLRLSHLRLIFFNTERSQRNFAHTFINLQYIIQAQIPWSLNIKAKMPIFTGYHHFQPWISEASSSRILPFDLFLIFSVATPKTFAQIHFRLKRQNLCRHCFRIKIQLAVMIWSSIGKQIQKRGSKTRIIRIMLLRSWKISSSIIKRL